MEDKTTKVMEAINGRFNSISIGSGAVVAIGSDDNPVVIGETESLARRNGGIFVLDSSCEKANLVYGEIYTVYRTGELPAMVIEKFIGKEIFRRIYFESSEVEASFVGQRSYDPYELGVNFVASR